jgi:hypothetical protein
MAAAAVVSALSAPLHEMQGRYNPPYAREDLGRGDKCTPLEQKFAHGDPLEPRVECNATLNQLTYGAPIL